MKILCDHCHNIIWPKTAKMTVTPTNQPKGIGKKQTYHFKCWLDIASKDTIYEISKAFREHKKVKEKDNEQYK
jgi:nitrate/TMAO reductase-like tetraheme cytochrome c subunit